MARLAGMALRERWSGWKREPFTSESTRDTRLKKPAQAAPRQPHIALQLEGRARGARPVAGNEHDRQRERDVQQLAGDGERDCGCGRRRRGATGTASGKDALRIPGHAEEHRGEGSDGRDRGTDHPVLGHEQQVERDADERRAAGDHPVELRPLGASDADRHHDVRRVGDPAEGEQRNDAAALVVGGRRQQADEPGGEQPEREREPRRECDEVGEGRRRTSVSPRARPRSSRRTPARPAGTP